MIADSKSYFDAEQSCEYELMKLAEPSKAIKVMNTMRDVGSSLWIKEGQTCRKLTIPSDLKSASCDEKVFFFCEYDSASQFKLFKKHILTCSYFEEFKLQQSNGECQAPVSCNRNSKLF